MPRGRAAPARSSSAASSRARPASSPSPPPRPAATHSAQPSAPHHSAPAPMHAPGAAPQAMGGYGGGGGGMLSGLMGSVVTGAAMGTGSAMAHRAVDSFMGPRETVVTHQHEGAPAAPAAPMMASGSQEGPCANHMKSFAECMTRSNGDMGSCQWYFDAMQQCKNQPSYA